ncbi:MAG TPA: hypothetical protein VK590_02065 [Saprospiraceae bacterium]|nr:hypothetical protein [Saprospiraceae bacterium]
MSNTEFTYGKYKGKTYLEVLQNDRSYYHWMSNQKWSNNNDFVKWVDSVIEEGIKSKIFTSKHTDNIDEGFDSSLRNQLKLQQERQDFNKKHQDRSNKKEQYKSKPERTENLTEHDEIKRLREQIIGMELERKEINEVQW